MEIRSGKYRQVSLRRAQPSFRAATAAIPAMVRCRIMSRLFMSTTAATMIPPAAAVQNRHARHARSSRKGPRKTQYVSGAGENTDPPRIPTTIGAARLALARRATLAAGARVAIVHALAIGLQNIAVHARIRPKLCPSERPASVRGSNCAGGIVLERTQDVSPTR